MESLIGKWVGKDVSVILRLGGGIAPGEHRKAKLDGNLIQVGEAGVILELPTGRTFVPVSAIQQISLPKGQ